ncbi:MAG TPA: cell envelope integrity protein TolA [Stenotrophomonas sp.]|uniref:cell envelope integrity protein TolA n=1 Tax=Stenotrophomonas pigmentata TaxID=3055080 RepID=UPI0026ECE4E4|nr:cell envelope integrity protein TolA [Stenotrophomonas sp. 610A2]
MHADALPPPHDNRNEWGLPVVLALLVHLLVAAIFIIAWVWSPSRSTEAAAGDPALEANMQLSAAEASAARQALRASEKLPDLPEPVEEAQPEPVPEDTVPPPQPIPEPRPQDAPTPQQHNAQERIAQPDNVDQERVSALAISQEKARQEQEAKRRQEQIDLTERKRVEEAEQKLRLAKQQEEADRKKLADQQRQASEAQAEQERQQKIAEIRRKREQAEREAKLAEQRLRQVADARARAQATATSSGSSGPSTPSPGQGGTSNDLTAKYAAAIQQAVVAQWTRPDNVPNGTRCRILIKQLPGGGVASAEVQPGCAMDAAAQDSIERAVLRAQPLPFRGYETVFRRELLFTFTAQD